MIRDRERIVLTLTRDELKAVIAVINKVPRHERTTHLASAWSKLAALLMGTHRCQ
jgi:hypothetical protein